MIGFDNTFFGVGGPEVVVVLVVGYFVLGPVELVKLVKQAGILVGQLRDAGMGTVTNLSTIMDDQVCAHGPAKTSYSCAAVYYFRPSRTCPHDHGRWGCVFRVPNGRTESAENSSFQRHGRVLHTAVDL